jgi:hypothetical protein
MRGQTEVAPNFLAPEDWRQSRLSVLETTTARLSQTALVTIGVFMALAILGYFAPDLRRHVPGTAGQIIELAIFLGLIAIIGYAKLRKR